MRIRTRLTLWYAGILFISVLAIGTAAYLHFREERRAQQKSTGVEEFLQEEFESWDDLVAIGLWCGVPAGIIGLGGGWFLTRKALAPVAQLIAGVERIQEGNLRQEIPRTGSGDELDRLTEVFNQMTARVDEAFSRVRQFTLHASHELKTPLTILRAEMETALRHEALLPEQRQRLESQVDEVDRLTHIVDGLTLLTKADAGQLVLKTEPVRLDEILREAIEDAATLAGPSHIEVNLLAADAITITGDRHRLRQLLLNLLDNGIKYNHRSGRVCAELRRENGAAQFTITNTGPGIPPEKLPRVFERFYRGDESHSSTPEGCGLGLSIAQWIVTAHAGTIQLESDPRQTTVTLRLPIHPTGIGSACTPFVQG